MSLPGFSVLRMRPFVGGLHLLRLTVTHRAGAEARITLGRVDNLPTDHTSIHLPGLFDVWSHSVLNSVQQLTNALTFFLQERKARTHILECMLKVAHISV